MGYVDGFVIAAPTAKKQDFIDYAHRVDILFKEYGALRVVECWGDTVPAGKKTDFFRAVEAREDETVIFSWVEWPDKATRDAAMAKMIEDPRMDPKNDTPPFDGSRMIFGGFEKIIEF